MLVDANILLFAVDTSSPFHHAAATWLTSALQGPRRVGLPWESLSAFLRICTSPRAFARPLKPEEGLSHVAEWLDAAPSWIPLPTERHAEVLGDLVRTHQLRGNLITDANLAALAIEHGLTVISADTDFARFGEVRWENPLRPAT